MPAELDLHYDVVAKRLEDGRVVPLLGAGINLCGRKPGESWASGSSHLPSGAELASHLIDACAVGRYVSARDATDLPRVAQTVAAVSGRAPLYEKLHAVFDREYEPNVAHRFLARLPGTLKARGSAAPNLLILTTNYDDALERAFAETGEAYDVVWYAAEDEPGRRGRFWHWPPPQDTTDPRMIERPNEYDEISLDERTVIMKFHGAVDRTDPSRDSYVITEDHYIDYLTRTHVSSLIPAGIMAKLTRSHFLFLAYALRDWNVRVILHRIWASQRLDYRSWAVQRWTDPVDTYLWAERGVEIFEADLGDYVRELAPRLGVPL